MILLDRGEFLIAAAVEELEYSESSLRWAESALGGRGRTSTDWRRGWALRAPSKIPTAALASRRTMAYCSSLLPTSSRLVMSGVGSWHTRWVYACCPMRCGSRWSRLALANLAPLEPWRVV